MHMDRHSGLFHIHLYENVCKYFESRNHWNNIYLAPVSIDVTPYVFLSNDMYHMVIALEGPGI